MTFHYEPEPLPDFQPRDMPSESYLAMILAGFSGAIVGFGLSLLFQMVIK